MTVALSVAIQHHPSRADLLPDLLDRLAGLPVEVVEDPDPTGIASPWRCYQACLERTPAWCSHRLIVQDDAVPIPGFAVAAIAALNARPDRPVAFWVGGALRDACHAMTVARKQRQRWIDLSPWQWFPCVASAWPSGTAAGLLEWLAASRHRPTRADDAVTARFLQTQRIWPLATVPCLVEHPDVVPSVIGKRAWAGRDKGRIGCVPATPGEPLAAGW